MLGYQAIVKDSNDLELDRTEVYDAPDDHFKRALVPMLVQLEEGETIEIFRIRSE